LKSPEEYKNKNIKLEKSPLLEEEEKVIPTQIKTSESALASILEKARTLGFSKRRDEYRVQPSDEIGGITLLDQKVLSTLRAVAKEYLKQLFGKIFSGQFNLTTISFPIKCMRPISLLETFGNGSCLSPLYLNKAAMVSDPVEKIKYLIVSQIGTFHITSNFLKPVLN